MTTTKTAIVVCLVAAAQSAAEAQGYCVDATMKAFVACPPASSPAPAPLMKDEDGGGGRIENEPPDSNAECGRGLGFCCFCHTALATPVQAPPQLAEALRTSARPFWERHSAVVREIPASAMNRTMKETPRLREPYAALMRTRASSSPR